MLPGCRRVTLIANHPSLYNNTKRGKIKLAIRAWRVRSGLQKGLFFIVTQNVPRLSNESGLAGVPCDFRRSGWNRPRNPARESVMKHPQQILSVLTAVGGTFPSTWPTRAAKLELKATFTRRRGESTLQITLDKRLLHRESPVSPSDARRTATSAYSEGHPRTKSSSGVPVRVPVMATHTSSSMTFGLGRFVTWHARAVRDDWNEGTVYRPPSGCGQHSA